MGNKGKWALAGAVVIGFFVAADMIYPTESLSAGCDTPRAAIQTAEDAVRQSLLDSSGFERQLVTFDERPGVIEVSMIYTTDDGEGDQTVVVRPDCSTQWG